MVPFQRRLRARSQPLPPRANLFLLNLFRGKKREDNSWEGGEGERIKQHGEGHAPPRQSRGEHQPEGDAARPGVPSAFLAGCRFSLPWKRLMHLPWAAGQGRAVAFGRGQRLSRAGCGAGPAAAAPRERRGRSRPEPPRSPSPRSCGRKTTTFVHSKPRQTAKLVYSVGFGERINCFL